MTTSPSTRIATVARRTRAALARRFLPATSAEAGMSTVEYSGV